MSKSFIDSNIWIYALIESRISKISLQILRTKMDFKA
jgi:predicted nucleic acid-binding protein